MMKTKIALLFIAVAISAGCATQLPVTTTTAFPQVTNTLTPEIEPSATTTRTSRPANTPTFTPTPTWTPLPTLSAQEAQAKIAELLETNGGCELPCWWGITPNKTKWTDTSHFLRPFVIDLVEGDTSLRVENGKRHAYTNVQFYFDAPNKAALGRMTLGVIDDVVVGMTVYPPGAEYQYQLHQLLSLLEMPRQIYISAQQSAPIPTLPPTVLVLDYSDFGVWASYGYIPSEVGENLVICPETGGEKVSMYDNVGGRLNLFDPSLGNPRAVSIQEYADMVGGFTARKLEDVTNMTIETFYNTFIDPETKTCLETPADLWP